MGKRGLIPSFILMRSPECLHAAGPFQSLSLPPASAPDIASTPGSPVSPPSLSAPFSLVLLLSSLGSALLLPSAFRTGWSSPYVNTSSNGLLPTGVLGTNTVWGSGENPGYEISIFPTALLLSHLERCIFLHNLYITNKDHYPSPLMNFQVIRYAVFFQISSFWKIQW